LIFSCTRAGVGFVLGAAGSPPPRRRRPPEPQGATPCTGGGLVTVDLDATLVTAFSEAVHGSPATRPAVLVLISGQL
jgi:hypothetical protein